MDLIQTVTLPKYLSQSLNMLQAHVLTKDSISCELREKKWKEMKAEQENIKHRLETLAIDVCKSNFNEESCIKRILSRELFEKCNI